MRPPLAFSLLLLLILAAVKAQSPKFECESDADCYNGGSCIAMQTTDHYCQCPSGFGGMDCSAPCDRNCLNGGSCRFHDRSGSDTAEPSNYCECIPHQFEGANCEIPYTECPGRTGVRCFFGGTCQRTSSGYDCECPEDRHGDYCQYHISESTQSTGGQTTTTLSATGQGNAGDSPTMHTSSTTNSSTNSDVYSAGRMAFVLLVIAVCSSAIITLTVVCVCGKKRAPMDTTAESEIMAGEAANWS